MAIVMNEPLIKVKKKSLMSRHECKSRSNMSRKINNSAFSSKIKRPLTLKYQISQETKLILNI